MRRESKDPGRRPVIVAEMHDCQKEMNMLQSLSCRVTNTATKPTCKTMSLVFTLCTSISVLCSNARTRLSLECDKVSKFSESSEPLEVQCHSIFAKKEAQLRNLLEGRLQATYGNVRWTADELMHLIRSRTHGFLG
jgi:hypothetical protein